jgi:undecaprenyl-diphosphatase
MTVFQALCLGVLQGITEFLPVSSSGHLVLAQHLFGLQESQLFFDVVLHVGTLLAVFLVFRSDILVIVKDSLGILRSPRSSLPCRTAIDTKPGAKMALMIVAGSIPTAVIGLLFKDTFEHLFGSPTGVGLGLWATGLLLLWSRWSREHSVSGSAPRLLDAVVIGLAQGAAITPGLSRSGATITTGLLRGLKPELAFRFSFLLSIPAILGALLLELSHRGTAHPGWMVLATGFLCAFLVGWIALLLLQAVVKKGRLFYFSPYCLALGTLALLLR